MDNIKENSEVVDSIKDKYFVQRSPEVEYKEPLKQNLQADVSKIDATIKRISEKQAARQELFRLKDAAQRLIRIIDIQLD